MFEIGVPGAALEFVQRVLLERIKAAECPQPFRYWATWAEFQSFSARTLAYSSSTVRAGLPYM